MTDPGSSSSTAPLVAFGSEHEGTGWWKFVLDSASHAMFLGGSAVTLYDGALNELGSGVPWTGNGAIDLFESSEFVTGPSNHYSKALWGVEPFSDVSILMPGTYYIHATGGVAFGYHQSSAFGHWVDTGAESWQGADPLHYYHWEYQPSSLPPYVPYSTDAWNAALLDAINCPGVVATADAFTPNEGAHIFAQTLYSGTFTDPTFTLGTQAYQTAWGLKPNSTTLGSYPYPDLPDGSTGLQPEGPGSVSGARAQVVFTIRFGSPATVGPTTHLDATHVIRTGGFTVADMDTPRAYSSAGTTMFTATTAGPDAAGTFDASSIMAPDGSFTLKSAIVINRADIPDVSGTSFNHDTRAAWRVFGEWLVRAPRFRFSYWLPYLQGVLYTPPTFSITGQLLDNRCAFSE